MGFKDAIEQQEAAKKRAAADRATRATEYDQACEAIAERFDRLKATEIDRVIQEAKEYFQKAGHFADFGPPHNFIAQPPKHYITEFRLRRKGFPPPQQGTIDHTFKLRVYFDVPSKELVAKIWKPDNRSAPRGSRQPIGRQHVQERKPDSEIKISLDTLEIKDTFDNEVFTKFALEFNAGA
jgi:hypothetical protein